MFLFLHLIQACKIQVREKGRSLMHRAGNQEKLFLFQAYLDVLGKPQMQNTTLFTFTTVTNLPVSVLALFP